MKAFQSLTPQLSLNNRTFARVKKNYQYFNFNQKIYQIISINLQNSRGIYHSNIDV